MWPFKREKKYWVIMIMHPQNSVYMSEILDGCDNIKDAMVFSKLYDVKRVTEALYMAKLSAVYVRVRVDQTEQVALGLV